VNIYTFQCVGLYSTHLNTLLHLIRSVWFCLIRFGWLPDSIRFGQSKKSRFGASLLITRVTNTSINITDHVSFVNPISTNCSSSYFHILPVHHIASSRLDYTKSILTGISSLHQSFTMRPKFSVLSLLVQQLVILLLLHHCTDFQYSNVLSTIWLLLSAVYSTTPALIISSILRSTTKPFIC